MKVAAILFIKTSLPLLALSSELLQFRDIVITETRHELELELAPSPITVMGIEELETRSRESLRDILLFDSSLFTLRSRGSDFLSIRGFTQGRVLIDGRRLSGEVDRTFELDRITLERVVSIVCGRALELSRDLSKEWVIIVAHRPNDCKGQRPPAYTGSGEGASEGSGEAALRER